MDIKSLRWDILFRAYRAPLWCAGIVAVCLLALWWTARSTSSPPRLRTVLLWAEGVGAALAAVAAVFLGFITLLFSDGLDRSVVLKEPYTTQDGTYPKGTKVSLNRSLDRIDGAELAQPTQIAGISFVGSLGIIEGPDVSRRFQGTLSHAVELYGIPCGPGEATLEASGAFVDCQVSQPFHYTEYRSKMFVAAPDGARCAPGPGSFSAGSLSCVLAAPATISGASLQAGDQIEVYDLGAQPDVSWTAHDPLNLFSIAWPAGTKVQLKGDGSDLANRSPADVPPGTQVKVTTVSNKPISVRGREVAGPAEFNFIRQGSTARAYQDGTPRSPGEKRALLLGVFRDGDWQWTGA